MSVIKSERTEKNKYELEIAVDAEAFAAILAAEGGA